MTDRAAHLVDHVFPEVPIRQWVLTLPPRLRYLLAWDHTFCRAVVAVYLRAVLGWLRHQAKRRGVMEGRSGGVTALNNPLVQQYTWSTPTKSFNPSPTIRLDYEVTRRHRLTGSFNYRHINSTPDTTNSAQLPFPNSQTTGSQQSTRWTTSESLRSTFGDSVFNEFRIGGSGGATLFSPELEATMWSSTNGYRLNLNGACCGTGAQLTDPSLGAGQSSREASTKVLENTTTWLTLTTDVLASASPRLLNRLRLRKGWTELELH